MVSIFGIAWENIIVALLAGGLVSSLSYLKTFIARRRIEKKFKITGEYISKFEDEHEGKKIVTSAPVVLTQKGYKIYGETYLSNENRKWILEGNISLDGHIYGVYSAEDPIDKSIGNFFLKVDHKHKMEGLWSGFDSSNNKINSGKYSFFPVNKNIKIQNYEPKYIPQILALSDKQLGQDYLNIESLTKIFTHPNNYLSLAMDNNGTLAGFCLGYIIDSNRIEQEFKINLKDTPNIIKSTKKLAVLKTIAVSEKYQGLGIGSNLVKNCTEHFKRKDLGIICSIGWKSKNGTNIERILIGAGFEKLNEIPKFWNSDSIEKNYNCPVCGNPCNCSAVIFCATL
jgi:ribosomal protein S18 acetylase RimI-like enzyme